MTDRLPLVTIMIPAYNQERYISQAIESALMQDYGNLEIIVADDCSTDGTEKAARKYISDPRFKYYRNDSNLGRVGNYRNTLTNHATGEWTVNLDGDDYYTDKSLISKAMSDILSQKDVVCLYGRKYYFDTLGKYNRYKINDRSYCMPGKIYLQEFNEIGEFAHMVTIYRRDVALMDGKCYTMNSVQSDFHALIRLCIYGNVIISRTPGYQWRRHGDNASASFRDFKLKYLQSLRTQNRIMADIGEAFTPQEKAEWLSASRNRARNTYVIDTLKNVRTFRALSLGLKHFRLNRTFLIIYVKAVLATVFRIDCFK